MVKDSLRIIASAHVILADRELNLSMSSLCIKLAELLSITVDFPKTCVLTKIPSDLCPKEYPDFREKPVKAR